jgi:two-component system, sensor histidine kinase and response regulator
MNRLTLVFICCTACHLGWSQSPRVIDSLMRIYNTGPDTTRNLALSEIAKQYYRNIPDTSLLLAKRATDWAEEHDYEKGKARAYNITGLGLLVKGGYDEANEYFQKSIPLFISSRDKKGLGFVYNNIGLLYYYQGENDQAFEYFQKALAVQRSINHDEGTALSLNNAGLVYEAAGKFLMALENYREALVLNQRAGVKFGIAQSHTNIGFASMQLKEYNKALESLHLAKQIQREINDQSSLVSTYMGLAEVYNKLNLSEKSIQHALDALRLSQKIQSAYDAIDASKLLYRIYKEQQKSGEALRYFELHKKLTDSIFRVEKTKAIATLQSRMELETKQKEVELLKVEKGVQSMVTGIVLVVLVCAGAFTYWLFHNRKKLQLQSEKLDKSNKVKDKIFSIVSHDLRSPLNALKSMFALLESKNMTAEEFRQFIPDLSTRLNHASDITEELLLWSRNQLDRIELKPTELDVNILFKKEADRFKQSADEKGIVLKTTGEETLKANADADTIQSVLRNLVSNAIKFCQTGSSITLHAESQNGHIKLSVNDTGVGIKSEDLPKIFSNQVFTTQGTSGESGTGLGLMLCKEFVEKNGGKIGVDSTWGKGTSFWFTLPVSDF